MEYAIFGRTGLRVSRLAFGAGPIGFLGADPGQAAAVLERLLDAGVNVIDTAAGYLGSEELIGQAVAHRRSQFVLLSKCGKRLPDVDGEDWSPDVITRTVDRSLRRLRTDHLDVMLLHTCPLEVLERGEALEALLKAKAAGKIRFAGYSGDNAAAVRAAGLSGVDVLMCSLNVVDQANLEAAVPAAVGAGLGVIVKRTVANAAWKPMEAQEGLYREYVKRYAERFQAMALDPAELGAEGPDPWPELALRFTLALEGPQVLSIGTTRPASVEANLRTLAKGPLPAEAVTRIREAFDRARGGAEWPGLS